MQSVPLVNPGNNSCTGKLKIILVRARLERDTEMFGSMDPYVHIKIDPDIDMKSKVSENGGKNPGFARQKFEFQIRGHH